MRALYFDCYAGISGDMILGALLDLGVDEEDFRMEMKKLALDGYKLKIEKKTVSGITGTDVYVKTYASHAYPLRGLAEIRRIIETSGLKPSVIDLSIRVFTEIARAEAKVHNKAIEEVTFHEVGAVDSIVDIVGSAVCLSLLGAERVFSSPLHDGKGFVECESGKFSVPVPAVLEMLKGSAIPYFSEDVDTELITPTGLGFIKTAAVSFGSMPALLIDRVGYGFGKRETGRFNALRVVMGELFGETDHLEEFSMMETGLENIQMGQPGYTMDEFLRKVKLN